MSECLETLCQFFFYKTGICDRWRSYLALETNVNIMDTCKELYCRIKILYTWCFTSNNGPGGIEMQPTIHSQSEPGCFKYRIILNND
jgi:hypothetical protein